MQLAYGTVQRVRTLDHAIETLGRRPVRKLDPPVRAALRIGAYQLAYMDGVPAHAAVDESVELVRRAGLERAVAFTNAVLRRLSEGLPEVLARLHEETPAAAALMHSYPDWVAETWWRELGPEDARALMRRQNEPPETAVRTPEGPKVVETDPARLAGERLRVASEPGLAARGRSGGRAGRRARSRSLRCAGREGDPARRGRGRGRRGREACRAARESSRRTRGGSASS